jgi:hypothetical protein
MRPFPALASLRTTARNSRSEAANSPGKYFSKVRRSLPSLQLYVAFVVLALIAGPIDQFVSSAFLAGAAQSAALGFASFCAALVLAVLATFCRHRAPHRSEWIALLVLALPQWFLLGAGNTSVPALHLGWGTQLLLSLAAPLWLGLLSASGAARIEVPRAVIAAAIAGMGAVCLSLPVDVTAIGWGDAPALLLNALLGVAVVASWVYARPRLAGCPAVSAAAAYLGLSSVGYVLYALLYQHDRLHVAELGLATLLAEIATLAVAWVLWFWLLRRLSLAGFSVRMLASYAATLLFGFFYFGLTQWRMDAAFVISCIAVIVALRATPAGEQPLSLGLTIS